MSCQLGEKFDDQQLTFYDALYAVLAAALGVPLVTADERLASAPALPCHVDVVPGGERGGA